MNREWVLHHLSEAHEELTNAINEIREHPEYESGEFFAAMSHLYHHLNTAWNGREATEAQTRELSRADFKRWSAFPTDIAIFE
jgi:hypothetical protein